MIFFWFVANRRFGEHMANWSVCCVWMHMANFIANLRKYFLRQLVNKSCKWRELIKMNCCDKFLYTYCVRFFVLWIVYLCNQIIISACATMQKNKILFWNKNAWNLCHKYTLRSAVLTFMQSGDWGVYILFYYCYLRLKTKKPNREICFGNLEIKMKRETS